MAGNYVTAQATAHTSSGALQVRDSRNDLPASQLVRQLKAILMTILPDGDMYMTALHLRISAQSKCVSCAWLKSF